MYFAFIGKLQKAQWVKVYVSSNVFVGQVVAKSLSNQSDSTLTIMSKGNLIVISLTLRPVVEVLKRTKAIAEYERKYKGNTKMLVPKPVQQEQGQNKNVDSEKFDDSGVSADDKEQYERAKARQARIAAKKRNRNR